MVTGAAINGGFVLLLSSKSAVVSNLCNMDDKNDFNGTLCAYRLLLFIFYEETEIDFNRITSLFDRSQWPRGLRRRSAAARLLRSWVRIPPGGMDVCLLSVLCVVR